MGRNRHAVAVILFAALALVATTAAAEPPAKPAAGSAHDTDAVRDLMRTGVAEYKKGNLQAARDAFLQAWTIKPHYAIAASLAEVEMALGQYRSTAEHLEYYLSNLPSELDDKRSAAQSQLAEAKKHLTVLRITADAPDATVYVDGVAVEPGRELLVDPGPHTLVAERGNVRTQPREVVFVAGQTLDEHLETKPAEPAPPIVATNPSPPPAPASTGDSRAHAPTSVLIVGGALTLVALGIGVGYSLDSSSAQSDADRFADETIRTGDPKLVGSNAQCAPPSGSPPPACAELHDALEHSNHSHDIAVGSFIASGVFAAGTLAAYFLWPVENPRPDRARLRLVPSVGRGDFRTTFAVSF